MKKIAYYILVTVLAFALPAQTATAQQNKKTVTISGTVVEAEDENEALPFATIRTKDKVNGQIIGIAADVDGKFTLPGVPIGSAVEFSCVGFDPVVKKITKAESNMIVKLKASSNMLTEVVTIGYHKKSKADNTSAVTVIKTEDLTQAPVSNVMELLQGRVAGLNIQMNNGAPGASGTFTIRGISDISVQSVTASDGSQDYILSSSAPLFVIDGIPQEEVDEFDAQGLLSGSGVSPLSTVPFEDIANIQVLKDAAATALYGSKGAYGVVLIETKKGDSEKPRIEYSMDMKVNTPPRLRDVLVGRAERMSRINQILENDTSAYKGYYDLHKYIALSDSLNPYFNNNTDWQNNFYRTTVNQSHNLSVSGGSRKFNYKVNGNYYTEDGIIKSTKFDRYGLRTSIGWSPNDRFSISANVNTTLAITGTGGGSQFSQKGVASGSSASSMLPPPSLYSATSSALTALLVESDVTSVKYDASVNLSYRFPFGLRWNLTGGYTYSNGESETFTPGALNGNKAKLSSSSSTSNRLYGRTSLSYDNRVSIFKYGMDVGVEISSNRTTGNSINFTGLPSDYIWGPIGYAPNSSSGTAHVNTSDNTLAFSFTPRFGLGTIGGAEKYVFNPSLRPEANSAYGKRVKWVINPGLGFKWNWYLESFVQDNDWWTWLNYSALRVSWGRTTKYRANRYNLWGTYLFEENSYNGSQIIPIDFGSLPNPDLDPVKTTQWNIGLDLNAFNRLQLDANAYYKQVDNQLSDIELADHNAFSKIKTTEVSIVNYGFELGLNVQPLPKSCPVNLNVMFNFSVNKSRIAKLPDEARQIINSGANVINKLGSNALSTFMYVYKGVYATDEDVPVDPTTGRRLRIGGSNVSANDPNAYFKAGDPIWADLNGDYIIDERDKTIVGNAEPKYVGGIAFNVKWKDFSIYTNCSFTLKRDIVNKVLADNFASYKNPGVSVDELRNNAARVPIEAYNFWTKDNIYADYPNPFDYTRADLIQPFRADQTLFMEDGSYFKINGITLSYSLPKKVTSYLKLRYVRFRVNVSNIYTFTNYSGISPENVNSLGYDTSGGYPSARSFSLGLAVGF